MQASLAKLQACGWQVAWHEAGGIALPSAILSRYGSVPDDVAWFLQHVAFCKNADETVWFNCANEFLPAAEESFAWDEWERMSLDSCSPEEALRVRQFWGAHLPIAVSVASGYDVFVVATQGAHRGAIFHASEPEFEVVTPVAASFAAFLSYAIDVFKPRAAPSLRAR